MVDRVSMNVLQAELERTRGQLQKVPDFGGSVGGAIDGQPYADDSSELGQY